MTKPDKVRWTNADVEVVERTALGFGMVLGGGMGVIGLGFGIRWLSGAAVIGGIVCIASAIRQSRQRPWWRLPDGPGRRHG